MDTDVTPSRALRRAWPAICIVLVSWLLLALAQGIPTVCALAYPCPAPDVRVAPAVVSGALLLLPLTVVLVPAAHRPRNAWVVTVAYAVLVILAVVGLATVAFSGGFSLPLG